MKEGKIGQINTHYDLPPTEEAVNRDEQEKDEIIRQKIVSLLKENNVISEKDDQIIFDMDVFLGKEFFSKTKHYFLYADKRQKGKPRKTFKLSQKIIFDYLADMKVISKDEYEKKLKSGDNPVLKPLFYVPESIQQAFDLARLENKNYYLDYWDMSRNENDRTTNWCMLETKDSQEIDSKELFLFQKIFGDFKGQRDENDDLVVFDKTKNDFVKISVGWIKNNIGNFSKSFSSLEVGIHNFLMSNCPNMLQKGLLRLDDFKTKAGGESSNLIREEKIISGKTTVSFDSAQYAVGRSNFPYLESDVPRENIKLVRLDPRNIGIVKFFEGKEELLSTFPLLTEEEKKVKESAIISEYELKDKALKQKEITARMKVSVEELLPKVKKWDKWKDNPRLENESEDDYKKRVEQIGNYGDIKRVTKKFTEKCQVGIHNLTWREQQWLAHMNYQLLGKDNDRLVEFGKRYGLEGLKTFLSCELDEGMSLRILDIGENLDPEHAKKIFVEYARIVDNTDKSAEEVSKIYNEVFDDKQIDKQKVVQAMLRKGYKLLKQTGEKIVNCSEENKNKLVEELIDDLKTEEKIKQTMIEYLKKMVAGIAKITNKIFFINISSLDKKFEDYKIEKNIKNESDVVQYLTRNSGEEKSHEIIDKEKKTNYEKGDKFDEKTLNHINCTSSEKTREAIDRAEKDVIGTEGNKYLDSLKELLKMQISLENKLEQMVTDSFHADTDLLLLEKFQEIRESIKYTSQIISDSFAGVKTYVSPEKIEEELFKEAIDIISMPTVHEEDREKALKKLNEINASVLLTGKIISQLPKEEVVDLDLKKIKHIERIENVSTQEIVKNKKLLEQIKETIRIQFPDGDEEIFEKKCKENPNWYITMTLANNKILSFFVREKISEDVDYMDWFIANPDAPIKGLGEATLKLGFDEEKEKSQSCYAVAKPHIKSFYIAIEKLGFVSFGGATEDGEYQHHYARIRRLPTDENIISKNFSKREFSEVIKILDYICDEPENSNSFMYKNKIFIGCKVVYHGQTHEDDIKKEDKDGWILGEIERQYQKGNVLTRFIPLSNDEGNREYYAIFEKNQASIEDEEKIWTAVNYVTGEERDHRDSKKALSK